MGFSERLFENEASEGGLSNVKVAWGFLKDFLKNMKMRLLREVRRPRLLLVFPLSFLSITFLAAR